MTTEVTDATFADDVLASDLPVLVDFWAEWCPPCHRLKPVLADLSTEYAGRIRIVTLDVDTNPHTQRRYGVMSMPTLTIFRNGEVVSEVVGFHSKSKVRAQLDNALT